MEGIFFKTGPRPGLLFSIRMMILKGTMGLGSRAKEMTVSVASYEVTDPTIDSQIVTLHTSGTDVLVEFVTPKSASRAIRKVYEIGWRPTRFMSVTGALASTVLKLAGPDKSVGIIAASAGMDPSDPQWSDNPDIKAFRYLLQNFYPEGDQNNAIAFLDYSIADVFFQVVRRCGDELSREHLVGSYTHVEGLLSLPCSRDHPSHERHRLRQHQAASTLSLQR
jgi:branched-chain amino acid transport system substrate-binding protein